MQLLGGPCTDDLLCFPLFSLSLSPPAGGYSEVQKSYSLSSNTNPGGATTGQLLESRVGPWIRLRNDHIFGVNDTNSNVFCLQLQTLGLVRSSKQSCRTLWLQGACSPSERSSEKVGARDLQRHWCSLTQKCYTEQHRITVDFHFKRGIWLCGGGTFETSRGNVRKSCSEDDEMWDFWN